MKTLKTLIDEYFEERVSVDEITCCHHYDVFLNTYYTLMEDLERYGVDGIFPEWYDFVPDCWDKYLIPAIKKYVKAVLEPKYKITRL